VVVGTILFALLMADAPAVAAPPRVMVTVDEAASLPDGVANEIRGALESRAATLHAALVEVHLTDLSAEITVDGRSRSIAVTDWEREGAARVVVMHALDLAGPAPDLPVLIAPPPPANPVAVAPGTSIVMSVAPLLSRGTNGFDALALGAELTVGLRRDEWRVGAFGRYTRGLMSNGGSAGSATFDLWPVGLAAGWSWGSLETAADVFVASERVEVSAGPAATAVTYGGGLSARWLGAFTPGLGWFAGVGADAFARRIVLEFAGDERYATPRVSIYATAGATFGFAP
jgi:hypothetical protein